MKRQTTAIAWILWMWCIAPAAYAEAEPGVRAGRVVHFPADRSIGRCYIVEKPAAEDCRYELAFGWPNGGLMEARGDIEVPAGRILRLDVWDSAGRSAEPFETLGSGDVAFLNFHQYAHADDSTLAAIGRLSGLEVLFLADGQFTRVGVKHLIGLKHLGASGIKI